MEEKTVNHFNEDTPSIAINDTKKSSTISILTVSSNGTILNDKPHGEDYIASAAKKTRAALDLRDWFYLLILFYVVAILF